MTVGRLTAAVAATVAGAAFIAGCGSSEPQTGPGTAACAIADNQVRLDTLLAGKARDAGATAGYHQHLIAASQGMVNNPTCYTADAVATAARVLAALDSGASPTG
jgi:hypothetical protein